VKIRQAGVTLIELIVTITVLSLILPGAVMLLNAFSVNQARNLQTYQGIQVADLFLNEALQTAYSEIEALDAFTTSKACTKRNRAQRLCLPQIGENGPWQGYEVVIAVDTLAVETLAMKHVTVTITTPLGDEVVVMGFKGDS